MTVCEACDGFYNGCTMVGNPKMSTCGCCRGEGRIHLGYNEATDENWYDVCPSCKGAGEVCVSPDIGELEEKKSAIGDFNEDDVPF